jgi:photosystem II stability/assembly factor-like uncharacterized protein
MARVTPRPKARPGGKDKAASARRRAAQRRRTIQRRSVVGIATVALVVIVFLATRPDAPEGPASTALAGGDFHSLIVDPENPNRVFAGGHQTVSVSTDGGKTWREIKSLKGADAMGWAFIDEEILVGGHPGISVSTDGGKTFRQDNKGLPSTDVHALGAGDGVIYAASPQVGVFVSTDGRRSWEIRSRRAGQSFMGRILVDPNDPERVLAPDMAGGVAESRDGGRTWRDLGGVRGAMWVSADPTNPSRIVASGQNGAAVTTDGGASWEPLDIPDGVQIVDLASSERDLLYAGRHDGERVTVYLSRDGGKSWIPTSRASP